MTNTFLRAALLASCGIASLAQPAFAADTAGAETANAVTANEGGDGAAADQSTSANQAGQANDKNSLTSSDIIVTGSHTAQTAPITASLTTTQPQAAVSREFIDNAPAASDFYELIALTPGVSLTGTGNGAGFSESKAQIRGFQDGEYNVTYDSIPFADTNNPTHHSTAFFPSNTIETVVVDRGPGNASQLGQATYGGNINLYSRAASDKAGVQLQGIAGVWNTFIARAEFQSGAIESLGGAKVVLTGQYLRSDGALTFSPVESKNLYGKIVLPIGSSNTLTLMSTWNQNHYFQSDVAKGATCGSATAGVTGFAQAAIDASGNALTQLTGRNCAPTSEIGTYGQNFGLSNDPSLASYWQYNRTDKKTDFSYARLQSDLGSGFSMDNRVYTYGYTNNTYSGNVSPTISGVVGGVPQFKFNSSSPAIITGFSGAGTPASPYVQVKGAPLADVLGYNKLNQYRVYGYIGQLNYEFSMGKVRLGGWYEHSDTDRHIFDLDRTTGLPSYNEKFNNGDGSAASNALPPISLADTQYLQKSSWNQYQLFAEFEFRPMEGLSITPGVKYVHFTRGVDAVLNQKSRTPANMEATWTKVLPFATINWSINPSWSVYGQYAQGMYVPDLSSFYSSSGALGATLGALQPQTSTNYQIGTVWHGRNVSLDFDAYAINVNNKIGTCTGTAPACDSSLLINIGSVRYKGVEGQVSVMPLNGLTFYANGSYNYAHSVTTGAQIAKTPFTTAALGLAYNHGGLRVSFNQKYVGPQYATEYSGSPGYRLYRIKPFSIGEFAISQEVGEHFRIGMTVSNVFNSRAVTSIANSSTGAPTSGGFQSGYGQLDTFQYLPPRSAQVDVRLKF
jgi:iron complex outermembrane recepter protein